jgi:hypothetical protein
MQLKKVLPQITALHILQVFLQTGQKTGVNFPQTKGKLQKSLLLFLFAPDCFQNSQSF